jgi:peptide deformylase
MATFTLGLLQSIRPGLAFSFAATSTRTARRTTPTAPRPLALAFFSSTAASQAAAVPSYMTQLFSTPSQNQKEEVDPGVVQGTDLRVAKYPSPFLRLANAEITQAELDDGSIHKIAKEMFLVMYAAEGVGLAAPQVGVNKRLMVYNQSGDKTKWLDEVIMVNPYITEFSEAKDIDTEGCLSFPDMTGQVERSKWIKVKAMNLRGKPIKKKYTGWEARIFQHEYDHLDGVVYIDHLSEEGRAEVKPVVDDLIQEFGANGVL